MIFVDFMEKCYNLGMKRQKWLILAGAIGVLVAIMGCWAWMQRPKPEVANNSMGEIEFREVTEGLEMLEPEVAEVVEPTETVAPMPMTSGMQYQGQNYTLGWGKLMLINPIFTVGTDFIAARRNELVDLTTEYGVVEGLAGNGRPLLDAEAAPYLAKMVADYRATFPGHDLETRSCFRAVGTRCGRLCYATGTSDHHTGYTCDLIDPAYGAELDTDLLARHVEWQWLKEHSWKYGFIDRFPLEWAGGPMSEPINITAEGSTGLYETWHYRYVGIEAAREIAEGKYNEGRYDSLEHYLKATGRIANLLAK